MVALPLEYELDGGDDFRSCHLLCRQRVCSALLYYFFLLMFVLFLNDLWFSYFLSMVLGRVSH
eukprot:m.132816 g.132816  ORF g.132816 m.132816 type:complete len:63 (-) comp15784_c0_seq4:424-612(-)